VVYRGVKAPRAQCILCVQQIIITDRSQWSGCGTLSCEGPRVESRCGQKSVFFHTHKSLRYAALGTGCTLTAVPRSTQPSILRGTANEYHNDDRLHTVSVTKISLQGRPKAPQPMQNASKNLLGTKSRKLGKFIWCL